MTWQSAEELRRELYLERKRGEAAWVALDGLGVEHVARHGALLRALAAFGLGSEPVRRPPPATVVLDWTTVVGASAEALALFVVLVRLFCARGVRVLVCEPSDGDVAGVLRESGARAGLSTPSTPVTWVPCADCPPGRSIGVLVPAAHLGGSEGKRAGGEFLAALEEELARACTSPERVALVTAAASELVHNVLRHARAEHAMAVALLHRRRRPRVVELGIADSGEGITTNILRQPRHAWLVPLADRGATAAVFGAALSGRDAADGGGGMTRIMRRIVEECGATVLVRSGAARVKLVGEDRGGLGVVGHTVGWGTQTRLSVPVA